MSAAVSPTPAKIGPAAWPIECPQAGSVSDANSGGSSQTTPRTWHRGTAFGIVPTSVEAEVPSYLWRFRPKGQYDEVVRDKTIEAPAPR